MGSAESWANDLAEADPRVRAIACFGSYARGDDGVGSDLDLLVVVQDDPSPPGQRSIGWNTEELPVPAELVVYTEAEWRKAREEERRFWRTIAREAAWLWRDPAFEV